jgi:hypothetical protein
MSLNLGTLLVQLRATTADFKKDMSEAKKAAESFAKDIKPATLAVGAAFAGLAASIALVTKAAGDEVVSQMRLKIVFGENAEALAGYADQLARSSGLDDAMVRESMKLLGAMGLNAAQTQALVPHIADMAALMGVDMPAAAKLAAMAINNGSGALSRSGIAMSEQQKATFDSINMAGRLAMMMDILGDKAGGMAQAMTGTVPGALAMVKNAFGDLTEELGMGFQDLATGALKSLHDALRGVGDWFHKLTPEAKETAAKIALVATGALGVATALGGIGLALPGVIALFSSLGTVMMGAVLPAIPWILLIGVGIAGAVFHLGLFKKAWDSDFGYIRSSVELFVKALASIFDWLLKVSNTITETILKVWNKIAEVAGKFGHSIGAAIGVSEPFTMAGGTGGSVGSWGTGEAQQGVVASAGGFMADTFKTGLDMVLDPLKAAFADLFPAMEELKTGADKAAGGLGDVGLNAKALAELEESRVKAAQAIEDYEKEQRSRAERLGKPSMGGSLGVAFPKAGGGGDAADYSQDAAVQQAMANIRYADVANSVNKMFGEVGLKLLESWDSVKGTIGDALSGFGKVFGATLLGSAGQLGETVNAAMQGFQSGGPWGAIAAVIASLLSKTQSFQDMISHINEMFGGIIEALEPLMRSILPLVVLINMLVSLIFAGLAPVFEGLGYVFEGLFYVVKYLALGVMYVVKGIGWAYNQIIEAAADLADYFWDAAGDEIRKAKLNQEYIDNLIEEWASMTPGHARAVAWASGQDDPTVPLEELGDAAGDAADDISGMTEQLTNVPEGFKVALARYHSISTEGRSGQIFGANTATQGGGFVNNGTIVVQANDPEEFERKLEEKRSWDNYRSNGSPILPAPAYSGG